ncbi:MAG TPA: hypothetical protein VHN19_12200 [Burkholderiales bacterium]|nr:hypothetical protein [Burkholderiales bacterium]
MRVFGCCLAVFSSLAFGITPDAREFLEIAKQLEPVHCERRQLRREIVMAETENRMGDLDALKRKFARLSADPRTAKLEKRLAVLEARLLDSSGRPRHPEDLDAISLQQRQAFYNCD